MSTTKHYGLNLFLSVIIDICRKINHKLNKNGASETSNKWQSCDLWRAISLG